MDRVPQSQAGLGIWSPIESINHATVVFYGAKNCHYKLTGHTLPLSVLETQIIQPYTAFLEQVRQRREAKRQARLAAYGRREEPAAGQVERYVRAFPVYHCRSLLTTATAVSLDVRLGRERNGRFVTCRLRPISALIRRHMTCPRGETACDTLLGLSLLLVLAYPI